MIITRGRATWIVVLGLTAVTAARAAIQTWTGAAVDNNWSTPANWSTAVPGATDTALFDGTSTKDCTIDTANPTVSYFIMAAGYAGTVTAPAGTLQASYGFTVSNGTFVANGGTVRMRETGKLDARGVTFHNLEYIPTGSRILTVARPFVIAGNMTLTCGSPTWTSYVFGATNAPISLHGDLTIQNFNPNNSQASLQASLVLTNAGNQTFLISGGNLAAPLFIDKPSGGVTITAGSTNSRVGSASYALPITLNRGTLTENITNGYGVTHGKVLLNGGTYKLDGVTYAHFRYGDFTVGAGAVFTSTAPCTIFLEERTINPTYGNLIIQPGGSFSTAGGSLTLGSITNGGTLNIGASAFTARNGGSLTTGGITFNDFKLRANGNRTFTLMDNFAVSGNFELSNVNPSWGNNVVPSGTRTIRLAGSYLQTNALNSSTYLGSSSLTLVLDGTNHQDIAVYTGTFRPILIVSNAASARLQTPTRALWGQTTICAGGLLNLNGNNFTSAAPAIVYGTLRLNGDEVVRPNPTLQAGSTVQFDGRAGQAVTIDKVYSYRNIVCDTPGRELRWQAGSTFAVAEGLSFQGEKGANLLLRSTSDGSPWFLTLAPGASQSVTYVDVRDSDADLGQRITAFKSIDSTGNENWFFRGPDGTVIQLQ